MLKRLTNRLSQAGSAWKKSERGSAAVEFALVAGPFIMILGTIIETGLMLFTEYTLQSSVQDAARLVRTGQAQMGGLTVDQFKQKICDTSNIIIDCSGAVTVYVRSDKTFALLANNLPSFLNVGSSGTAIPNPTSYAPGGPGCSAAVVATYDWYFSMWGMSYMGNIAGNAARRLVGFAVFKSEPFPGTGTC